MVKGIINGYMVILKLKKTKFHHYKNGIFWNDVDTGNTFISKKISSSNKYYK